jgi:hypothetical protein
MSCPRWHVKSHSPLPYGHACRYSNFSSSQPNFASQAQMAQDVCPELTANLWRGVSGAVIACGHSGTGKTHTLIGEASGKEEAGLLPRLAASLLHTINSITSDQSAAQGEAELSLSIVEVANDKVPFGDLLPASRNPHRAHRQ